MNIEVINTTQREIDELDIKNIYDITMKKLDNSFPYVSVVIVDNKKIQEINKQYRNKDSVTDVISFAFEDEKSSTGQVRVLGEIYISIDKAETQAKEYNHPLKREICFLTVHGLLHLLGYNHEVEEERTVMRQLEESVLNDYNVKR